MNPKTIWRLDRLAGTPACAGLSFFEFFRRLFARGKRSDPKRIIFIKLIEMGSTVLACPAFQEATRLVGKDNMFILVFSQNRVIVDILPYFKPENVLTIDDSSLGSFIAGLLRAIRRTRKENIDTAIDMEGLTRSSAIITYLTGARKRVGYFNFTSEGPYRGRLFSHELNYNFQHHVSLMFYGLVRASTANPDEIPVLKESLPGNVGALPEFAPTDDERATVEAILTSAGKTRKPKSIVLLNPNCSDLLPLRRWPIENFVQLGKTLLAETDELMVVITGDPSEKEAAEDIARSIGDAPRVISVAGHTTLRELLTLYCLASLLVSNDSGPCHFAGLTPIPVIALFGPETPQLYGPLSKTTLNISANLACSPCVNILNHRFSPCTDNKCMQSISVETVYSAARNML